MPLKPDGAMRLLGKLRNGKQFAVALQYIRPAARFIHFGAQPVTAFTVPLKMAVFFCGWHLDDSVFRAGCFQSKI
jgi:hypothetical protein